MHAWRFWTGARPLSTIKPAPPVAKVVDKARPLENGIRRCAPVASAPGREPSGPSGLAARYVYVDNFR